MVILLDNQIQMVVCSLVYRVFPFLLGNVLDLCYVVVQRHIVDMIFCIYSLTHSRPRIYVMMLYNPITLVSLMMMYYGIPIFWWWWYMQDIPSSIELHFMLHRWQCMMMYVYDMDGWIILCIIWCFIMDDQYTVVIYDVYVVLIYDGRIPHTWYMMFLLVYYRHDMYWHCGCKMDVS